MLKFHKSFVYLPNPTRSQPNIPEEHKQLAAESPPMPLPLHCRPWIDEQSLGWTFFYGYLTSVTLVGLADGRVRIENFEQLQEESGVKDIIRTNFFGGYAGLSATGYTITTPPGVVSLMMPPTTPPQGLLVLPAILETDWFPRELIALFQAPLEGEQVRIEYGDELLRILPVSRFDDSKIAEMNDDEVAEVMAKRAEYVADEKQTKGRLTKSGGALKRVYPRWSKEFLQQLQTESEDE